MPCFPDFISCSWGLFLRYGKVMTFTFLDALVVSRALTWNA